MRAGSTRARAVAWTALALVALVLGLAPGYAFALEPATVARIDRLFVEYTEKPSPGCSAGITRDGQLEWSKGYGLASLEHAVAIDQTSVFRIASTSKQFTAAVILLLEQQGVLSRDDDVRKYLPELHDYNQHYGRPVTLRHLLHHTSGYRDYLTLQSLAGKDDRDWYDEKELVELLAGQLELNFAPGSDFLYSNSGYFLLSRVALRATGKTLRELARELIFGPLGMTNTHFHDDANELVAHRAHGYEPAEEGFRVSQTLLDMVGDGGVFTTVPDLAKWDANFYDSKVGGPAFTAAMQGRGVVTRRLDEKAGAEIGTEVLPYANGLTMGEYRGLATVSHGGGFVGYRAQLLRFPDQKTSFIVLCNVSSANPSRLARGMADVLLSDRMSPPEERAERTASETAAQGGSRQRAPADSAPSIDRLVGDYRSPELDVVYRLFGDPKRNELFFEVGRREPELLTWQGDERWRAGEIELRFWSQGQGPVAGFDLDSGRVRNLRFERVQ